jgi:hypothetical protein
MRMGAAIFGVLTRTARQVLPQLAQAEGIRPGVAAADEESVMHSPCL